MKKYTYTRPRIRSRHPSHNPLRLRGMLPMFPFPSVVRFGSQYDYGDGRLEINSIEAVRNSSDKLKMKTCFDDNEVKTAKWFTASNIEELKNKSEELGFPIVVKHRFGSRGTGNYKINNLDDIITWSTNKDLSNYIFEKYHAYLREYRLHVTKEGCFYTCRKMLKNDTPDEEKWFRNDSNSVWILETNDQFDRPVNWKEVEKHCVKALKGVGLDIGAVDLKIQSATDSEGNTRAACDFIVIEINSAPSFGDITLEKYKAEISKLIINKHYSETES